MVMDGQPSPPERAFVWPMRLNVVSLREPIDCRTQYGVWPQDQDFALRIVVAGDLAGDDPFSVDKFALLHIAAQNGNDLVTTRIIR